MPIQTRTFRIFVSSTFADLKVERDALQREVFPKLRKLCEAHGARFQAIDLRWGVRDEAALDQKTMEICLREIERCQRTGIKPNFIVLLGQRYGWRPLPARIEAREFEAVRDRIANVEERGLANAWYQRDNNAVPPEYLLRPREGEWVDRTRWEVIEPRLHRILLDAARAARLPEGTLVKYWASATHQEILKGLGAAPEDRGHVFAICRQEPDSDCDPDLVSLKNFLRTQLPPGNVLVYSAADLERFCAEVERRLSAVIDCEAAAFESRPALALEIEAHDAFAHERAAVFGREKVFKKIAQYVRAGGRPLVLHGASGSGKSAVMAQASEQARAALPPAVVVRRFIGASPESSSGMTLLRGISEQVGEAYGATGELPADLNGVARVFRERLAFASSERPLVIFIDALDQLGQDDAANSFDWLGQPLPPHCRVVVSTTDLVPALSEYGIVNLEVLPHAEAAMALNHWLDLAGRQLQRAQRQQLLAAFTRCGLPLYLKLAFEEARGWASYRSLDECRLGEGVEGMIDTLFDRLSRGSNHGALLVSQTLGYLAAARYGLAEDEMLDVLSADPRVWADFETRAHHCPPEHRLPVIVWSRLLLDLEPYFENRYANGTLVLGFYHRQIAASAATRFLAGEDKRQFHQALAQYFTHLPLLIEDELAQSKRPHRRKVAEQPYQQLEGGMWGELEATLTDPGFVAAKCGCEMAHDLVADYNRAGHEWPGQEDERLRAIAHQREIHDYTASLIRCAAAPGRILLPPPLPLVPVQNRNRSGGMPQAWTSLDRINAWRHFVSTHITQLTQGVEPVFQLAWNHAASGPVADQLAQQRMAPQGPTAMWLRLRNRPLFTPHPACLRVLEDTDGITSACITADANLAVAGIRAGAVRIWDLTTGKCLKTIEAHRAHMESLSITPDGKRALTGGGDGDVCLWNLETGECLNRRRNDAAKERLFCVTANAGVAVLGSSDGTLRRWNLAAGGGLSTLRGPAGGTTSFAITPDGRRGVSGTSDGTMCVWDLRNGECMKTWPVPPPRDAWITKHDEVTAESYQVPMGRAAVAAVAISANGELGVSADGNGSLRLWNLMTGECVHILQEYGASLASVSITPDAGRAVTGGCDMCVRLWDLGSGRGLKVLRGHTDGITTVSITPDGRRAVSGARDEAIRVWDLESGECPMNEEDIPAVYNAISTVSISPDGVLGVSGGDDAFVRVWDWSTTECRKVLKGHTSPICAFAIAPDGDHGISGAHDGSMRLWNLVTGECERVLQENTSGEAYGISAITITPDAARAISVNSVGWIDIWDLAGGERLRHIQGGAADSAGLFSLDGRLALSKDYQNLYVWDLATAKCLRVLRGHTERIDAVLVTPDCQRGVSKDYKTIRVWDFVSGECLEVMERPLNGNTVAAAISGATGVGAERLAPFLRDWDLATYRGIKILNPEARALDAEFVTKERSGNFRRNHNNTLAIRDYATAQCATMGAFGSVFESVHVNGDSVMAGEAEGRIDMITVENHLPGVPVVTVTRLWRFAGQSWDSVFTVRCPSCGQRFEADVFVQGNGPSTWESSGIVGPEHRLRSSGGECRCPHCNRSLRLGPIVCDNSAVLCKTR